VFLATQRAGQLGDGIPDRATDGRRQNSLAGCEARLRETDLRRQIGDRKTSCGEVIDDLRYEAKVFAVRRDPLVARLGGL